MPCFVTPPCVGGSPDDPCVLGFDCNSWLAGTTVGVETSCGLNSSAGGVSLSAFHLRAPRRLSTGLRPATNAWIPAFIITSWPFLKIALSNCTNNAEPFPLRAEEASHQVAVNFCVLRKNYRALVRYRFRDFRGDGVPGFVAAGIQRRNQRRVKYRADTKRRHHWLGHSTFLCFCGCIRRGLGNSQRDYKSGSGE